MSKNAKTVEVISSIKWSEGRRYAVYGVIVHFGDGRRYRCEDISCERGDVERFAALLREEKVTYEELPFLTEDFVCCL